MGFALFMAMLFALALLFLHSVDALLSWLYFLHPLPPSLTLSSTFIKKTTKSKRPTKLRTNSLSHLTHVLTDDCSNSQACL